MKQTAVQWLALRYHHRQGYLSQEDIEQAKAMEKDQIVFSNVNGQSIGKSLRECALFVSIEKGEEYYNETYNK